MTRSHECSSRTCSFCRALVREPKRRSSAQTAPDKQSIRRAREISNSNRLVLTEEAMSANRTDSLEQVVLNDTLTTVVNSRTLLRELRKEISRAQRYERPASVCMVSLDGIPDLNKQFGAMAGDNLLKLVADVLRRCVRDVDIIGRYSSNEFLIVLPETHKSGAAIVADRIRNALAQDLVRSGNNLVVAAAASATFPVDGRKEEEIIGKLTRAVTRINLQARRHAIAM